jgi:hypothetical protein
MMLEKTLGVTLVTKLRTILLMEGDFNAANKIVYGIQMLDNAWGHQLMLEDFLSRKIEWRTAGRYVRHCSMISPGRQGYWQQLHQLMHQIAMIELQTQWPL